MVDRIYVLNLAARQDRLLAFTSRLRIDWPLPIPQRFPAVDGRDDAPPESWTHTNGAWGCLKSHIAMLEQCQRDGVESVLIFEDDVTFGPDFGRRAVEFFDALPEDWEMAYLGGCLRRVNTHPPEIVSDKVLRAFTVFGTYAYAIRGTAFGWLLESLKDCDQHIDRWYGVLHLDPTHRVYVPPRWLCGHADGTSDTMKDRTRFLDNYNFPDPITHVKEPNTA